MKPMRDGWLLFVVACLVVFALMLIPPDIARWCAIGLLVVVVLTPAVGYKPRSRAVKRSRGKAL
jgi:uncharacterized membrane protein YccC